MDDDPKKELKEYLKKELKDYFMKEFDASLESDSAKMKEKSQDFKIGVLQQLILQRYQLLTTISTISFAVAGLVISLKSDFIKNQILALIAATLFILIALISLGRHLFLIRTDIIAIAKKLNEFPEVSKPIPQKKFKADWWPETLYFLLVAGVLLFMHSFV